jgi:hypothetical protein
MAAGLRAAFEKSLGRTRRGHLGEILLGVRGD